MNDNDLVMEDMVGLSTDGASVMTGVRTGVAKRFKDEVPNLITSHCMAHRLQLVAEKAANCDIGILNQFAKSLKFSPKLQRILESKQVQGEKANKIKQVFFTQWLSFAHSVQALASCLNLQVSTCKKTM
ncbi:Uncharacterised protein at_DN1338 [Pycnogonum litorale]